MSYYTYSASATVGYASFNAFGGAVVYSVNRPSGVFNPVGIYVTIQDDTGGVAVGGTANTAGLFSDSFTLSNGNTISVTVDIAKGGLTIRLTDLNKTYTGTPLSPRVYNDRNVSISTLISYSDSSGNVFYDAINAGTYTTTATVTDPNWTAAPAYATFVIDRAPASIVSLSNSAIWDGNAHSWVGTTTPPGLSYSVEYTYPGGGSSSTPPTNVGVYPVTATITDPNHIATTIQDTFTISADSIHVSASPLDFLYAGTPQSPNVTINLGITPENTYSDLSGNSIEMPSSPGTYNLISSYAGTSSTFTYTIETPGGSFSNLSQTYTGSPIYPTFTSTGTTLSYLISYKDSSGNPVTSMIDAGEYTATASLTGFPDIVATFIISPMATSITGTGGIFPYDGQDKPAIATITPSGLSPIVITYNGASTPPRAIGTYAVVATYPGDNNHVPCSATATIDITQVTILAKKRAIVHSLNSEPMILRNYQAISEAARALLTDEKTGTLENAKQILAEQVAQTYFKQDMGSVHNKRVVNFR